MPLAGWVVGDDGRCLELGDFDPAGVRLVLQVFPSETARQRHFKIAQERKGISAIPQNEEIAWRKLVPAFKNEAVLVGARNVADIEDFGFGDFRSAHGVMDC